ncbi:unnamed protein product [Hymenolepis diminuta]|uniref:Uncharacterized protein n=1 Tax=Hymenolepis diminuta TaxID=6216 RepID=A0A158QC18_HYMDI|nr:unnamed protein product [Hymenolepis diminuta]
MKSEVLIGDIGRGSKNTSEKELLATSVRLVSPQSNYQTEQFVGTFKMALLKAKGGLPVGDLKFARDFRIGHYLMAGPVVIYEIQDTHVLQNRLTKQMMLL